MYLFNRIEFSRKYTTVQLSVNGLAKSSRENCKIDIDMRSFQSRLMTENYIAKTLKFPLPNVISVLTKTKLSMLNTDRFLCYRRHFHWIFERLNQIFYLVISWKWFNWEKCVSFKEFCQLCKFYYPKLHIQKIVPSSWW